jgi:hypothetical protein
MPVAAHQHGSTGLVLITHMGDSQHVALHYPRGFQLPQAVAIGWSCKAAGKAAAADTADAQHPGTVWHSADACQPATNIKVPGGGATNTHTQWHGP